MSQLNIHRPAFSGRVSRFATPTRRRSPFTAADAELSAITASCMGDTCIFAERIARCDGRASNCTPVKIRGNALPAQRHHGATSPVTVRGLPGSMAVSPCGRRCAAPNFMEVDAFCGSPRIHLAPPPSTLRQSCKRSPFPERSGSLMLQDVPADVRARKASLQCLDSRSASGSTTATPSLHIMRAELNDEPNISKCPFVRTDLEPLTVEESITGTMNSRDVLSPNSPSFSFFATVGEKRHTRLPGASLDSARISGEQRSTVSPQSFLHRLQQSPWNDTATASVSSCALPLEGKVFSPLRFDGRAVSSDQSQGLSSATASHYSTVHPLLSRISASHCHSADDEEEGLSVKCGSQGLPCDAVKQRRLLQTCLIFISRGKAERVSEGQRRRQRCLSATLRRLVHILLRLPFRILKQMFLVCANQVKCDITLKPLSRLQVF
ncbi:hypothetical protein ABL78_0380 [Leptomonas seymouri]|uniref:Uncharacterized protein n=1 Tax=Leptomonas seymouri TaxID=5684 RepID=A0A0N1I8U0_LEPSE|nr:hypothetical protein ABL78_0380 [Leptomonas seymouri]|eukprot:KPI90450.1 hypothetical protein ABL78_0380 [Leptomonas seymouri]